MKRSTIYSPITSTTSASDFTRRRVTPEMPTLHLDDTGDTGDTDGIIREQTWSALAGDRLEITHWINAECV